ncbi:MAG: hypothetical protein QF886_20175, partial [Planctomycetota bacterium]|nr:hypothetical protein [Planctomycetota bacterium]
MSSQSLDSHEVSSNIDLLAAWIEAQMAYQGQPGLSVGIVFGQELIWAKGFGHANPENEVEA